MKKLGKLNLTTILLILVAATTSVFAYFVAGSAGANWNISSGNLTNVEYKVKTENDLRIESFDTVFLTKETNNNPNARKIIVFENNITLTSNLTIEADANLNLNGFIFNLNGYNLTLRHNYSSNLTIYGGTITDSGSLIPSKVFVELPNANYYLQNCTVGGTVSFESYSFTKVVGEIKEYFNKYIAKTFVGANFDPLTYDMTYYTDDVNLLFAYKHYPLTFSYSSNTPSVVNNYGVLTHQTNDVTVTFSCQISDGNSTAAFSFAVTAVGTSDTTGIKAAAIKIVDNYFGDYLVEDKYVFSNDINLITKDQYLKLQFVYVDGQGREFTRLSVMQSTDNVSFTVKVYAASDTLRQNLLVQKSYIFYLSKMDHYLIIKQTIDILGAVIVRQLDEQIELFTQEMQDVVDGLATVSITFSPTNSYYTIANNILTVNSLPENNDNPIYLKYTFSFTDGTVIDTFVQVFRHVPQGEGGQIGLSGYEQAYYELLAEFTDETLPRIESYQDFSMPAIYGGFGVTYKVIIPQDILDIYQFASTMLTVAKNNTKWDFTFNYDRIPPVNVPVTIEIQFEGAVKVFTIGFEVKGLLRNIRPAGYTSFIDVPSLPLYNAMLQYFGKTASGILTVDEVLYAAKIEPFEVIGVSVSSCKGLEYLRNIKEYHFKNVTFTTSDLAGLMTYLNKTATKTLQLSNCGLVNNNLVLLEGMPNLNVLDLSSNGITSLATLPTLPVVIYFNISGNSLGSYDNIRALYSLKTIVITKNAVSIKPLMDLRELTRVDILGTNVASVGGKIPFASAFDDINVVNYILMNSLGINFYYNSIEVAEPNANEKACAAVLEAIFYYSISSTVVLPTNMGGVTVTWTYTINGTGAVTRSDANNLMTLTNIGTGVVSLTLTASVTIGGSTVRRVIVITINRA